MNEQEQLYEVAATNFKWRQAAQEIIYYSWAIEDEVEEIAEGLIGHILDDVVSVSELRGGVAWANALDKEAVDVYGSDLETGEQRLERTARRVMHLSGRTALEAVKSNKRRLEAHVKRARTDKVMVG